MWKFTGLLAVAAVGLMLAHSAAGATCACPRPFGMFRSCNSCEKYIICMFGTLRAEMPCAPGTVWVNGRGQVHADDPAVGAECRAADTTTTTTTTSTTTTTTTPSLPTTLAPPNWVHWCALKSPDWVLPPCNAKEGCYPMLRRCHDFEYFDFDVGWDAFKSELGNKQEAFFIGLDRLHELTKDGEYSLVVYMISDRCTTATYQTFIVGPESDNYRLTAGPLLHKPIPDWVEINNVQMANGAIFSTTDRPNGRPECHEGKLGINGWWPGDSCWQVNPLMTYSDENGNAMFESWKNWMEFRLVPKITG